MSRSIAITEKDLSAIMAASDADAPEIADALSSGRADVSGAAVVPADELLSTYRVRLQRWRDTGVPEARGFVDLVSALETYAHHDVAVIGLQSHDYHYVLLLSADLSHVLGKLQVRSPATQQCVAHMEPAAEPHFDGFEHGGDVPTTYTGWVYEVDVGCRPGELVPSKAIRSAWKVDQGALTGEMELNCQSDRWR